MTYLEKFTRGERRLNIDELRSYKASIVIPPKDLEDKKLQNLYRDCFGSHVTDSFGARKDKIELSNQNDRIISADNLTHVFLNLYYEAPNVYESAGDDGLTFTEFLNQITANPITGFSNTSYELGTNKVTYLVGDVGAGKSTYISRLLMEMIDDPHPDSDGYQIVPILYDFERRHKEGSKLKKIDGFFWADIYQLIYDKIKSNRNLTNQKILDDLEDICPILPGGDCHSHIIHHLKKLIFDLAQNKIRLFFIFDNLDRYHFHYTKVSFFNDYEQQQFESVRDNISALVNMFDSSDLSKSGLCILFVCRIYLAEYLAHVDEADPKDNHYRVYKLREVTAKTVINSRWNLYESALTVAEPAVKAMNTKVFRNYHAIVKEYFEHVESLKAVNETANLHRKAESPALDALVHIGHNGYRSLVKFLASLSLQHKHTDALNRLLKSQQHLLILLYIANNHQRYAQEEQAHFPNLFLCDCVVSSKKEFPLAHKPHKHTYWLKYMILKYLSVREQEGDFCSADDIINVFAGKNRYEDHLVKLVLGSLCTTAEFSCIKIEYNTGYIRDCRLTLTERGRYLVGHDHRLFGGEYPIDFCFNFQYLQMVIDDYQLAIPKQWYKEVFKGSSPYGYDYLYYTNDRYGEIASRVVASKIRAVFYFLKILQACLKFEEHGKAELFKILNDKKIIPDFHVINHEMLLTAQRLLGKDALNLPKDLTNIESIEAELRHNDEFENFFADLHDESFFVQK